MIIFKKDQNVSIYNPATKSYIKGVVINNADGKSVAELGTGFFYHVKGAVYPVLMLAVLTPRGLCLLDIQRYPSMEEIPENGNAVLQKLGDERNAKTEAFRTGMDPKSVKERNERIAAKFTAEDRANVRKYGAIIDTPRAAAALTRDEMYRVRKLMSLDCAAQAA